MGLDVCETDREHSFCSHAIKQRKLLVVEDTLEDDRFADNPLVTGDPFIRFYAGAPVNVEGHELGTLCIIDREPRSISDSQKRELSRMAHLVKRQIIFNAQMAVRDLAEVEVQACC